MKLVEAADEAAGELVIAALGPLTNLALACKLDSKLPSKIKRLVIMGGAERQGNITPCAEFNFHADIHAAQLVGQSLFSTSQVPVWLTMRLHVVLSACRQM